MTLFTYIFTMNIVGLIPKPMLMKPITPTANINVTFGLAFVVFCVVQFQGFKRHGVRGYRRLVAYASWGAQGDWPSP